MWIFCVNVFKLQGGVNVVGLYVLLFFTACKMITRGKGCFKHAMGNGLTRECKKGIRILTCKVWLKWARRSKMLVCERCWFCRPTYVGASVCERNISGIQMAPQSWNPLLYQVFKNDIINTLTHRKDNTVLFKPWMRKAYFGPVDRKDKSFRVIFTTWEYY